MLREWNALCNQQRRETRSVLCFKAVKRPGAVACQRERLRISVDLDESIKVRNPKVLEQQGPIGLDFFGRMCRI